jgi:8-oxo-dGTP pyrophosphatase MutT (NUDIX family)
LQNLALASVAVIINPEDRGGSILLIKRIERSGDPWSGQVGFPGGHKSPEDEGLLQTAIRETREEVGIALNRRELLGALPMVTTHSRRVQVAPFVFALESNVMVQVNREVAETFWLPLSELNQLKMRKQEVSVEEGRLEVDSFVYEGRIIWGLTFRILCLLIGRSPEAPK